MAVRDFADIDTQTLRDAGSRGKGVYISKSRHNRGVSDTVYISLNTHLIGEKTTDHSPHWFYTTAFDD